MKYHSNEEFNAYIEMLEDSSISDDKREFLLMQLEKNGAEKNDLDALAAANFYRALICDSLDISKSNELAEKAVLYSTTSGNNYFIMRAYNLLGVNYSKETNYFKSINNYIKAYQIASKHSEFNWEFRILNNIANLFVYLKDYETAVSFAETSYSNFIESEYADKIEYKRQIVLNIIELYSYLEEYKKVDHWRKCDVSFTKEYQDVLDCIYMMNEIMQAVDEHNVRDIIVKFIEKTNEVDEFIYIFRASLKVLEVTITLGDKTLCEQLVDVMKNRRSKTTLTMFDIEFYEILNYMEQKFKSSDAINSHFKNYYDLSRETLEMIKWICSKSLLMEIELQDIRNAHKDVVEEKSMLQEKVSRDPFTQLYNRVYMDSYITNELKMNIANNYASKFSLYFIDIDYFKQVNDCLGHLYGDKVLLAFAEILKSYSNKNILAGKYGGDEFILFVSYEQTQEEIEKMAQDFLEKAKMIKLPIEHMEYITCSIGIVSNKKAKNFKELCKLADKALYDVKKAGRNGYKIYSE